MIDKVAAYMKKYHMVSANDHICLGLSGGADSVCLFLLLEALKKEMQFTLSVVHIEHGIRGEDSLADMEFVKALAQKYQTECRVYAYPVQELAAQEGLTLEEAGRKVRYETFLEEEKRLDSKGKGEGGRILTAVAHHGDDNAETMLFHMCRGSSLEGLAGIRPVRGNIIRPLLCTNRKEIEDFLKQKQQPYCIDKTNQELAYSRNRIRNCVMPQLQMVNAKAVSHMNALAEDLAEVTAYLYGQVQTLADTYLQPKDGGYFFASECLQSYPEVLKLRLMVELMARVAGSKKDIGREHAKALLQICEGPVGKSADLPYTICAQKSYDGVCLFQKSKRQEKEPENPVYVCLPLETCPMNMPQEILAAGRIFRYRIFENDEKCRKIPINLYTKWFDYDNIENRLCFRSRQAGDYLVTDALGHRQKLKSYFINEKVPKAERDSRILLADNSHILWVIGHRISEYYKVSANTKKILEVQMMEEKS